MPKEIIIIIPDLAEIKTLLKEKFEKLLSWSFLHLKNATLIVLRDAEKRKWRGIVALVFAIAAFFLWDLSSALLWLLFLLFLAYEWENRIIAVLALISLASCPFLLALKRDALAETMAVYAYFFLAMTVALQMVEFWKEKKGEVPAEEKSSGKVELANFSAGFRAIIEKLKKIASIKLRKTDTADSATPKSLEKVDLLEAPAEKILLASLPQAKLLDLPKVEKEAEEKPVAKERIDPLAFIQNLIEKIENFKIKKPKFSRPEFKFDWNVLIFFGLAIVILWKMLLPGYILTLDMAFVPYMPVIISTDSFRSFVPISYLIHWASVLSSAWLVQKFILVVLFSGIGYMAFKYLPVGKSKIVRWFSALIYLVNPFVYTRLLAGQYLVLAGYALLPPLLYFLLAFEEKKDARSALKLFGWLFLIGVFSSHFFLMSAILMLVWFAVAALRQVRQAHRKQAQGMLSAWKLWKNIILGGIMFLILSSYWILPALTRKAPVEQRFGVEHWEVFAGGGYGEISPLLNLASLNGFWGERTTWAKAFAWPQNYSVFWLAFLILAALVIFGSARGLRSREEKNKTIIFLVIGVCAFIFSAGAGETIFRPLNILLYEHMPLWTGFRDSQKFTGFLALSYAVLSGMGLSYFLEYLKKRKFEYMDMLMPFIFLVPFLLGFLMWGGFHGQLKSVRYPATWFEAKKIMEEDKYRRPALVLPWHGYMSFKFNDNLVMGNPARRFFGDKTVVSRSVEVGAVYDQETDQNYLDLDTMIRENVDADAMIDSLIKRKVEYVLFFQDLIETDSLSYDWLKSSRLEVVLRSPELILYRIGK